MITLSAEQRACILSMDPVGLWRWVRIDRTGRSRGAAEARQQLLHRGLLEHWTLHRRHWRLTTKGIRVRADLDAEIEDDKRAPGHAAD